MSEQQREMAQRNQIIRKLREEGHSYAKIGRLFGLSPGRVREIVLRALKKQQKSDLARRREALQDLSILAMLHTIAQRKLERMVPKKLLDHRCS